jgi:hypothetical protein
MRVTKFKVKTLIAALGLAMASSAYAVDAFDPGSNLLTMDSITTGGVTYRNVAVNLTSYDLIGVAGGTPAADSFNPANNTLLLGAIAYQGVVYNNVSVKVNAYSILSVGGTGTDGTLGASTYTAEMASYFATLNNYRTQCGIPALSQNTRLDSAVRSWVAGSSQYTLAEAAGYAVPGTAGAISSQYVTASANTSLVGLSILQTAMMDPGALLNMMRPNTEVGMAYKTLFGGGSHAVQLCFLVTPCRAIPFLQ